MPPRRVGTVDTLGLALYTNTGGSLFYKEDGVRVSLHGNQKWTTTDGRAMKGTSAHNVSTSIPRRLQPTRRDEADSLSDYSSEDSDDAREERDIAAAIAASLQDTSAIDVAPMAEAASHQEREADAPAQAPSERTCCICLTNAPDHLLRPCRHLALCGTCTPRFRRDRLPCPVCRARVTAIDQIFHA